VEAVALAEEDEITFVLLTTGTVVILEVVDREGDGDEEGEEGVILVTGPDSAVGGGVVC
jgi:hypothetical protein